MTDRFLLHRGWKFFLPAFVAAGCLITSLSGAAAAEVPQKGVWITCIGDSNVLGSREAIDKAVTFAQRTGMNALYVQVYRGDESWFDSQLADPVPFKRNRAQAGEDTFALMIRRAHEAGLEVHAWLNTLTVSKNENAKILRQNGKGVLTLDQHRRVSMESAPTRKKIYLREEQLFTEPGDWRVRERIIGIAKELATAYPQLDGIHFDYIRYPASPPFIPGSRFNDVGLSYGYGPANVKRFTDVKGIDPFSIGGDRGKAQVWDDWKRDRVTTLLEDAAREAKAVNPALKISAAVLSPSDRAYLSAFQDWPRWIEQGIVDYVVLMNYSEDSRVVGLHAKAALGLADGDAQKVQVGLGAFLLKDRPEALRTQIELLRRAEVGGIVYFDYDSLLNSEPLTNLAAS